MRFIEALRRRNFERWMPPRDLLGGGQSGPKECHEKSRASVQRIRNSVFQYGGRCGAELRTMELAGRRNLLSDMRQRRRLTALLQSHGQ